MTIQKTEKMSKSVGQLLVLFWRLKYNHFLRVQNEICTYWVYLMEHIFFELQLCIEILIFKEKSNFGYTDHPEITTSLHVSTVYNTCSQLCNLLDVHAGLNYFTLEPAVAWRLNCSSICMSSGKRLCNMERTRPHGAPSFPTLLSTIRPSLHKFAD